MGKVISIMVKPVKKFNIENRAHKVISREKPVPAPQHKSTKKQLELAQKMNPTFMETQYKKDADLDDRLKNVYVQSSDPQTPTAVEADPNRPLPTLTRSRNDFEYGYWEPAEAALGRCSLKSAMNFMADHAADPTLHSAEAIALKYKLQLKDVENTLEYFRVFKVIVPEGSTTLGYADRTQIPAGPRKKFDEPEE